jgi:hypothetical protein
MQDAGDASGGETAAAEGTSSSMMIIIPPCRAAKASFVFMNHLYNNKYRAILQPFLEIDQITESFRVGRDSNAYGRLGPILVAAILPKNDGGFKTYCCNYGDDDESQLYSPVRKDHFPEVMETTIRSWVQRLFQRGPIIRRSCVILKFITDFRSSANNTIVRAGHTLTIGFDSEAGPPTFTVYDYRDHEYVYNVHEQLLHMAKEAARPYYGPQGIEMIRTAIVGLKGRLMADNAFMTCMSVAFRVCICLAKRLPLHESESDFEANRANLQHHIFAMLRWVQTEPLLQSQRYTALVSPEMAEPLFEISRRNCYLLLAPYTPSALSTADVPTRDVIETAARDPSSIRMRYSLQRGFTSAAAAGPEKII